MPDSKDPRIERPPTALEKAIGRRLPSKERIPRIEIKMIFAPHGSAGEALRQREEIRDADILFLEGPGFSQTDVEDMANRFATGELDPAILFSLGDPILESDERGDIEWSQELYKILYETSSEKRKVVRYLEPAEDMASLQEGKTLTQGTFRYVREALWENIPFDEAVAEYERRLGIFGQKMVRERDAYAVKSLAPKIAQILKTNPDIRGRRPIKIRIIFGSAHTGIYHAVRAGGKDALHPYATRTPSVDMPFNLEAEIIRKKAWGIPVTPELLFRGFAESVIVDFTHFSFRDLKEFEALRADGRFSRALVSVYNEEEVRALFALLTAGPEKEPEAVAFAKAKAEPVLARFLASS